ncbi:Predicted membrane protein [Actinopolyspora lacussalsi subsp. righensis]|uniref:Predicted membrane protein n=1 Tax=Actinopolyspora righensis TaxID=995060 RepID=A0A1I6X9M1_9ACTN|nr:Predicted membrane protein [Actinopolyspora righensis]
MGHGWTPSRLLAWIGGAVTLLGVVFLLVLAVQRGWLGPASRVLGGAGLGAVLLAAAFRVRGRPGGTSGSYALAATGFAVLYLDTVAATVLYDYLSLFGGLTAGFVIAGGGLLLSDRWRAQPVAVGVVVGCAVCAPLINGEPNTTLVGFLALLHLAATPVQLRHGWRQLAQVAALPVVIAAILADVWAMLTATDHIAVVLVVSTASLLGIVVATLTAVLRPDDNTAIAALVAAPIPVLLATPLVQRPFAAALAAGVAVVLTILWGLRFVPSGRLLPNQRDRLPAKFTTAAGGLAALAAMQATMISLDSSAWATALLCEALLLTLGALWLRGPGVLLGALSYATLGTVMALHHDIPPWLLVLVSRSAGVAGVLVGVLTALVAVAIPLAGVRLGVLSRPPSAKILWILSGILVLYGTASATMALVSLFQQDRSGFLTGHVLITLSWVVLAIALLLRGITLPSLRVAGMVLLPVALTKLFLFDLATLDGFARVVAFLLTGLVLLAAGVRYARALSDDSPVG